MADSYYAWNTFRVVDASDAGNRRADKVINVGDPVSPSDLGLDGEEDPDWVAYVENGAVRKVEHPDMGNFGGSPIELRKAQLAAESEGGFFDSQYGRVGTDEVPEVDPETGKPPEVKQQVNTPENTKPPEK